MGEIVSEHLTADLEGVVMVRDNDASASVREREIEKALREVEADYRQGRFVVESVEKHIHRIKQSEIT